MFEALASGAGARVTWPRAAFASLGELVAPTRCAGCDLPGTLLCEPCRAALPLADPRQACPRCGAFGGARWCGECTDVRFAFDEVRCAGVFEPPLSRCVTTYKDGGELRLSSALAALAAQAVSEWARDLDAVVAVPPSPAAIARRGFDHTARIACDLASLLGLPALDALVSRPRRDQRALSRRQRLVNAGESMRLLPGVALPARVLLLDDVLTTGATLDAAAAALRQGGAKRVVAVTVARACG